MVQLRMVAVCDRVEHIPGAVYLDLTRDVTSTRFIPANIPNAKDFERYMRELGINQTTHVICYEESFMMFPFSASRCWWTLKYFGHSKVSILDGGQHIWKKIGYPLTGDIPVRKPGNFKAKVHGDLLASFEDMVALTTEEGATQVVDVREERFFKGEVEEPNDYIIAAQQGSGFYSPEVCFIKGHMERSVSLDMLRVLDPDSNNACYAKVDDATKVFQECGLDLNKPLIFTCHLGMTACTVAALAAMLGAPKISVYLGSWNEWGQRFGTPKPEEKLCQEAEITQL